VKHEGLSAEENSSDGLIKRRIPQEKEEKTTILRKQLATHDFPKCTNITNYLSSSGEIQSENTPSVTNMSF